MRSWILRRKIKVVKLGRLVRMPRSEVERLIEGVPFRSDPPSVGARMGRTVGNALPVSDAQGGASVRTVDRTGMRCSRIGPF